MEHGEAVVVVAGVVDEERLFAGWDVFKNI